ncbi:MAG: ABC transporter permease [Acetobacterales bacterium]
MTADRPGGRPLSLRRAGAVMLRHLYLYRASWPRLLELAYWPTVQMVLWGLISQFFQGHSDWVAQAAGVLIGAVILWDILFRSQIGMSVSFFEEMYARNLGHLFVSPLRPWEFVAALMGISALRVLCGAIPAAGLAWVLYAFNILSIGFPLLLFFLNLLVMGWAIALLVCALVLRQGLGAESLAWAVIFALAPLSGVYYPVSTLPDVIEPLAWALPSAHVFEGMRAVMFDGNFEAGHLAAAAGLNVIYLAVGAAIFLWAFRAARRHGLLLNIGE